MSHGRRVHQVPDPGTRDRVVVQHHDGTVRTYTNLLQTDAAINPGNSGGALVTLDGALVGICDAGMPAADNLGFAIPSSTVSRVLSDRLIEKASRLGLWFGCEFQESNGIISICHVVPGGPIERAGIADGAHVVAVCGRPITTFRELRGSLQSAPEQDLPFIFVVDGLPKTVLVTPLNEESGKIARIVGIEYRPVALQDLSLEQKVALLQLLKKRPELVEAVDFDACCRVDRVYPGTSAARANIVAGDIIFAWAVEAGNFAIGGMGVSGAGDVATRGGDGMLTVFVARAAGALQGRLAVKH